MAKHPPLNLIGFDGRPVSAAYRALWTETRRDQFLIRNEVDLPLTVDTMAWPSVFDHRQGVVTCTPSQRRQRFYDGLPFPADDENSWGLWADLARMTAALARGPRPSFRPYWRIAIGAAGFPVGRLFDSPGWDGTCPDGSTLTFLGHDVADESQISGLANCGYWEAERGPIRAAWPDKLNSYHLFEAFDDADRFRKFSDARVAEHAPFWVYAIWRLDPA